MLNPLRRFIPLILLAVLPVACGEGTTGHEVDELASLQQEARKGGGKKGKRPTAPPPVTPEPPADPVFGLSAQWENVFSPAPGVLKALYVGTPDASGAGLYMAERYGSCGDASCVVIEQGQFVKALNGPALTLTGDQGTFQYSHTVETKKYNNGYTTIDYALLSLTDAQGQTTVLRSFPYRPIATPISSGRICGGVLNLTCEAGACALGQPDLPQTVGRCP